MKLEELKSLIKDKDLNSEAAQQEIVDAINNGINSVVKKNKESIAEELENYKAKIAENNLNSKKLESTIKELNDKISEQEAFSGKLKTKLYITGKAQTALDDQAMEDVITLASKRVTKDKTHEQAIDEVLNLYFNSSKKVEKVEEQPKVVKSQPMPNNVLPKSSDTNGNQLDALKSLIGVGSFKKRK